MEEQNSKGNVNHPNKAQRTVRFPDQNNREEKYLLMNVESTRFDDQDLDPISLASTDNPMVADASEKELVESLARMNKILVKQVQELAMHVKANREQSNNTTVYLNQKVIDRLDIFSEE